jgi:hypothetical protein
LKNRSEKISISLRKHQHEKNSIFTSPLVLCPVVGKGAVGVFPLWPLFHNTRTQEASGTKTKNHASQERKRADRQTGPPELCTAIEEGS